MRPVVIIALVILFLCILAGYAALFVLYAEGTKSAACANGCAAPVPGCRVKGNISITTGEKIYHLPASRYYDDTVINPARGERWFCFEQQAQQNGWRAALP